MSFKTLSSRKFETLKTENAVLPYKTSITLEAALSKWLKAQLACRVCCAHFREVKYVTTQDVTQVTMSHDIYSLNLFKDD